MIYTGAHIYAVDRKGRVVVPPEWRGSGVLWLTHDPSGGVILLPDDWEQRLPAGAVRDYVVMGAHRIEVDPSTGRVTIPSALRVHAGILPRRDVVWVGSGAVAALYSFDDWRRIDRERAEQVINLLFGGWDIGTRKRGGGRAVHPVRPVAGAAALAEARPAGV